MPTRTLKQIGRIFKEFGDKIENGTCGVDIETLNDIAKTSKDEKWKELPTISGELADALKIDISNLNAKLDYYLNLYGINKGQK